MLSILLVALPVHASERAPAEAPAVLLAGQLAVTAEVYEHTGTTVSVNVLPLIAEWAVSPRLGIRGSSLLNLQVSGPDTGLSHRGGAVAIPVYLGRGEAHPRHLQGWYLGPSVGVSSNPLVDGWDLTVGAEGGIRWMLGERGHLNLAVQAGSSRLDRPDADEWVPHTGFYPGVGVWLF